MTKDEQPTDEDEKEPIKVAFSLPQIAGGALAAATAAVIGSRLGVAGTIIGAMVASIVGGVAGTLYSAGIDRTHRKVSGAINRGYERVRRAEDYDPGAAQLPLEDGTPMLPGMAAAKTPADVEPVGRPDRSRLVWKVMGLSVAAMFVLALVAITVVELGLGRALDGNGGTTVGQVVRSDSTPTPKPTPTPSATASSTPTVTPTASTEPSVTPTPTVPEPTPSAHTPTAITTPVPGATPIP